MINLPFELGYMPPEIVEKAEKELGETEESRRQALVEFRKLVKDEKKLVCPDTDVYLLQFLRARKFNVKRTFSLLQNYYHVKKHHPEVYSHDFVGFRNSLASNFFCIMPYRDEDGAAVLICKLDNWNYTERKFSSIVHDMTIAILMLVEDPATQVCGIKIIVDVKSLSLNHVKNTHPKYLHLIAKGLKNCLPARFKAIHVINESFIFQYFWNVLRFVVSDKIRNRMHFHSSNLESLHKHFSPEILPVEYGGKINYDNRPMLKLFDSLSHVYDAKMSHGYKSRRASQEGLIGN